LLSSKIVDFTLNEGIINTIIPTNSNYFANFGLLDNTLNSVSYNINVNKTRASIGDTLTIIFQVAQSPSSNACNIILDPSVFYYSSCGGLNLTIEGSSLQRWVISFIFDGVCFTNTNDNC